MILALERAPVMLTAIIISITLITTAGATTTTSIMVLLGIRKQEKWRYMNYLTKNPK